MMKLLKKIFKNIVTVGIERMITKCYCGCSEATELFIAKNKYLVQCASCDQVYIKNFKYKKSVYEEEYFTETNRYIDNYAKFHSIFQSIIKQIKKIKHEGTLLDVGCGVGICVEVSFQNGFEAKGVEISDWASSEGRSQGLDISTGDLINIKFPSNSFDIVVLNHVLEHLPDPIEILDEIYRILKHDGILVIGVPNFGSYMSKLRNEKWGSLLPEEHIWHFTHDTLENLVNKSGFDKCFFEARENHSVNRNPLTAIPRLIINVISVLMNNSESMLLIAKKSPMQVVIK